VKNVTYSSAKRVCTFKDETIELRKVKTEGKAVVNLESRDGGRTFSF